MLESICQDIIASNSVALDIGANIAATTLLMAQYATEVHPFEPHPETFSRILSQTAWQLVVQCIHHNCPTRPILLTLGDSLRNSFQCGRHSGQGRRTTAYV